jgi:cobalt-zinc-cadmium efflux system outer membrane protein
MARIRRDAGDASELDVQLAAINSGSLENTAADDSVAAVSAILELQRVMGLPPDTVRVALADSLEVPSVEYESVARLPSVGYETPAAASRPSAGSAAAREAAGAGGAVAEELPLPVAAAEASFRAAEHGLALQRRSVFAPPTVQVGFETRDPTGAEPGLLPTVGISLPLPLLYRNRGGIALAEARRERARAELELARLESEAGQARARRERDLALARASRDRLLLESAERVSAMTATAYAEGAVALPNVLEAQRSARELLGRYVDDVASASDAVAALRLFTASAVR